MKKLLSVLILVLTISCNEKKEELTTIQEINEILNSNISLEEKYDQIYESGLIYRNQELTSDQQKEIGNNFFTTFDPTAGIEILPSGKINLSIEGSIDYKFKNRHFDKFTFNVTTKIKLGKKNFTSSQLFEYDNVQYNNLIYDIHHKLINDIEAAYGNEELVWMDKSYLEYKPTECKYIVEIIAENKVGEICKVILLSRDFTNLWENSMYQYYR